MKKDYKKYQKLLEGAKIKLLATDNGLAIEGKNSEILAILSGLMKELINNGVANAEELAFCLKYALNEEGLIKGANENPEKVRKNLKDVIKKINL